MKLSEYLTEAQNIYQMRLKQIDRDAKKYRKIIDKKKEAERKEAEKNARRQEKDRQRDTKKEINSEIVALRKEAKSKQDLLSIVQNHKNSIKPETYELCRFVAEQIDRTKTKKKDGTLLVTRNYVMVPRVINHPIVKNHTDKKVLNAVAKAVRIFNIELNAKFDPKDKIKSFRSVNNSLFNAMRDVALELMRSDMMEKRGVEQ